MPPERYATPTLDIHPEDEVDEVCRQILDFPHCGARAPLLPPELEVRVYS